MSLPNYIQDHNKFHLAGPPAHFLRKLWDFDASLVIVPSRQSCVYRLAQRRPLKLPDHVVNESLFKESDTQMLASYSLIPVTTILPTANWSNPYLLQELANRAPWRQGGADTVNARLEAEDHQSDLARRAIIDDITTQTAKDGWREYRRRIGLGRTLFI